MTRRIALTNHQSPGDVLMLTAAVRDLHQLLPGEFLTEVSTSCPSLWENNPYISLVAEGISEPERLDCSYPLIHASNTSPVHFLYGFVECFNDRLGVHIKPTQFKGDIHLSDQEKAWMPQVMEITREDSPYWIINAGGKWDYTIKWWDVERYQAVVDHFRGRIQFVQIGERGHYHPRLEGVIDLRGKTDLRQLVRLVYHAQGCLCGVTALMHLAAAVPVRPGRPLNRACVVVAGGREPMQWEAYPHHQYIHTNGALRCCDNGGCWKSRTVPLGDDDDKDKPEQLCCQTVRVRDSSIPHRGAANDRSGFEDGVTKANGTVGVLPRCMEMITAEEVIRRIEFYYRGGCLEYLTPQQFEAAEAGRTRWDEDLKRTAERARQAEAEITPADNL